MFLFSFSIEMSMEESNRMKRGDREGARERTFRFDICQMGVLFMGKSTVVCEGECVCV